MPAQAKVEDPNGKSRLKKAKGLAQVVEHSLGRCKTLSLISGTENKQTSKQKNPYLELVKHIWQNIVGFSLLSCL
jgi:hypothetical protein